MGARNWSFRSLFICIICNGILVVFFLKSREILGAAATPAVLVAGAAALTIVLWLLLGAAGPAGPSKQPPRETAPPPAPAAEPSPEPAIQILAALQRQGRLVDFLQEEIGSYDDGQIGAAVRNIHSGCKAVLQEHMDIRPIFQESEGSSVNVPAGFDAKAIRLTGNVTGDPPFRGTLRHRGWQAGRVRLPQSSDEKRTWILAPAEVEIE
jgi:Domain of unknown function (DUF2760)